VTDTRTDGKTETEMMKLIAAFRNFSNVPKSPSIFTESRKNVNLLGIIKIHTDCSSDRHADGRTDGKTETKMMKLIASFRSFYTCLKATVFSQRAANNINLLDIINSALYFTLSL